MVRQIVDHSKLRTEREALSDLKIVNTSSRLGFEDEEWEDNLLELYNSGILSRSNSIPGKFWIPAGQKIMRHSRGDENIWTLDKVDHAWSVLAQLLVKRNDDCDIDGDEYKMENILATTTITWGENGESGLNIPPSMLVDISEDELKNFFDNQTTSQGPRPSINTHYLAEVLRGHTELSKQSNKDSQRWASERSKSVIERRFPELELDSKIHSISFKYDPDGGITEPMFECTLKNDDIKLAIFDNGRLWIYTAHSMRHLIWAVGFMMEIVDWAFQLSKES